VSPALLLCAALLAAPEAPPARDPPAKDPLQAVAFLEGRWVSGVPGDLSEETWAPPMGRSMLGMWRYVIGENARVIELLTITSEPTTGAIVLRLRHFDGKLVAKETKDMPVTLQLVKEAPGEVRFEGPTVGDPEPGTLAITYRRSGPDGLSVRVDKKGKVQPFEFRRAR
jgi:hypothetical protein